MIKEENFEQNNLQLVKHYSDKNVYIKQVETEKLYDIAIDKVPCKYNYIETNEEIKKHTKLYEMIDENIIDENN